MNGTYIPTWAIAAVGALGVIGAIYAKNETARVLSLVTGIGLGGVGYGYNVLKQKAEIDRVVAAGGVYGLPAPTTPT